MSFDPVAYRQASLENWEGAAAGWARRQEEMRSFAAPVSHWMVDALGLHPGERVLELAAGLGETGMLAAEMVAPMGGVIVSDQAEAMLQAARARAGELGLANVEFQVLNAEWIDLPVASVDAVICRWGIMLMADPAAALAECRRVLRPGGRMTLAVWDAIEANPWAALPAAEMRERGLAMASVAPGTPGPFVLGDERRLQVLLEDAGFAEVRIRAIDLVRAHVDFDELWESTLDLSRAFHDAVLALPEARIAEVKESLRARFGAYRANDGTLTIPARTLVALAGA